MRDFVKAVSALAIIFQPLPSLAQSTGFTPEEVFDRFIERCSHVFSDPDDYLATRQVPGTNGQRVISVTPDGNVVSVVDEDQNAYEEIQLYIVGDRQFRECSTIGEFYGTDSASLAAEFERILQCREDLAYSGGHSPQDYFSDGELFTAEETYFYAIDGLWPDEGLLAVGYVLYGELQLFVSQTRP